MAAAKQIQVALAQLNPTVGDIDGNISLILKAYKDATKQGADLVVCPELCVIGYPPEDLVLQPAFRKRAMKAVQDLAKKTKGGAALIVGSVWEQKGKIYNAAILLEGGKVNDVHCKVQLPNYGIFDEKRVFSTGGAPRLSKWRGIKLGLLNCEDVWSDEIPAAYKKQGAELLVVINASPFEPEKLKARKSVVLRAAKLCKAPVIYVNTVGAQDDICFDGGSFIMSPEGKVEVHLETFAERTLIGCLSKQKKTWTIARQKSPAPHGAEASLWEAMKLGLADYVRKNNFPGIVLGLSGGIDSAISAAIAVEALGAAKVRGVLLPSPYTSHDSIEDAEETAKLLGIETMNIPITDGMEMFEEVLTPVFHEAGWMENPAVGGNVQARLRGMTLMAISNKFGWLLLSTGNKSEIAVGYTTLYGDSCGGYNVLKDLYKTQVYALAEWRNKQNRVIPQRSITKAPSAELKPNQKDQDQLPPYDVLDNILAQHIEGRKSASEIKGASRDIIEKVVKMVRLSEYKRRQSCPGVKLSSMMFGRDRRFPLTNRSKS